MTIAVDLGRKATNNQMNLWYLFKELTLGCAGVPYYTDVDISSQFCHLLSNFGNATKQHKKYSSLYLIISYKHRTV